MTKQEKQDVQRMRGEGFSYAKIAAALRLSENTVKSFCRRNQLGRTNMVSGGDACEQCGKPLTHTKGAKKRRFCSDVCRMTWWNAHPEAVTRTKVNQVVCAACGVAFVSYGSRLRKYCSRKCYGMGRRGLHA